MTPFWFALLASALPLRAQTVVWPKDLPRFQKTDAAPAAEAAVPRVAFNGQSFERTLFTARGEKVSASLVRAVDASRAKVYASLYALTLPGVTDALARAKGRGLDVRVLFDYGHAVPSLGGTPSAEGAAPQLERLVKAGIPVRLLRGTNSYGIMHNKFALFDGALLETGSFNWTTAADDFNHENALFRDDAPLLAGFSAYWDWMWAQGVPYEEQKPGQPAGAPPACADGATLNGKTFPVCAFSPAGGTEALLVRAVDAASSRAHVAMFSFTSEPVVQALARAKARGVEVLVALDKGQAARSPAGKALREAGVEVRLLTGPGGDGMLHDKFAVFDGLVETGSFNWSKNAELNSYENAVFSSDPADAAAYEGEFQKLWAEGEPLAAAAAK